MENFLKITSFQDSEMLGGPLQDAGLCQRSARGLASQCASFWNGNLSKWLRCVDSMMSYDAEAYELWGRIWNPPTFPTKHAKLDNIGFLNRDFLG